MRVWLTQRCAGGARILCVAPPGIQKCLTVVSLEALLNPSHVGAVCVFEFFVNGPFFFFLHFSLFPKKKNYILTLLIFYISTSILIP
jgi:hypothetical protein